MDACATNLSFLSSLSSSQPPVYSFPSHWVETFPRKLLPSALKKRSLLPILSSLFPCLSQVDLPSHNGELLSCICHTIVSYSVLCSNCPHPVTSSQIGSCRVIITMTVIFTSIVSTSMHRAKLRSYDSCTLPINQSMIQAVQRVTRLATH